MLTGERPEWMEQGACVGVDMGTFFPGPGETHLIKVAKRVCARCPVIEQCLQYALGFPDRTLPGIWAGTTERDRSRILRDATRFQYRVGKPN